MQLPETTEFDEEYVAFLTSYGPGQDSTVEKIEFVERLRHLLEMAARGSETSRTPIPDVRTMRSLNEGWIARLKSEEEMGGTVRWPTAE